MQKILPIFLLLSVSSLELAQAGPATQTEASCKNSDIRQTNPKIKTSRFLQHHFTVPRNQDSVGWCFAFTAADMISAYTGKPVSAMHTSTLYNDRIYKDSSERATKEKELRDNPGNYVEVYEGGWTEDAIAEVVKNGWVCSEPGLPFDRDKYEQIDGLIKDLENLKAISISAQSSQEMVCKEVTAIVAPFELESDAIKDLAENLILRNLNVTMQKFANAACLEPIESIGKIDVKVLSTPKADKTSDVQAFMNTINGALEKGAPLALDYMLDGITTDGGFHSSLITARRWHNGKCEYKIRNTWGEGCGAYLKGIDCVREEGAFWISDEKLFTASRNIRYISN